MSSMSDFFTRETANEGVKIPLVLPDGKATDQWVKIRGAESDEYRKASLSNQRDLIRKNVSKMSEKARDNHFDKSTLKLIASLVIDWSFEEKPTQANVIKFLKEAPQIADAIDRVSTDRSLFFSKKSKSSLSSPNTK